ncbi:MAG: Uma2 family endonuclease [Pseudomonadota bacterium]
MGQPRPVEQISADEYLHGETFAKVKHEYVDGRVYAMAGASERHNRIALNIAFQLRGVTRGSRCGVFMSDMKVRERSSNIFYYPDVMLVCDPEDDHPYYKERPCLIVEVLSSSTAAIDRREKWRTYRDMPSLKYYLIVDADQVAVEVYSRSSEGPWQAATLEGGEVLTIDCPPVQAALSLEDIYEDTGLALPV